MPQLIYCCLSSTAYLVGIGHYVLAGLSYALDPSCFTTSPQSWKYSSAAALIGVTLFSVGSYHQASASHLIRLHSVIRR